MELLHPSDVFYSSVLLLLWVAAQCLQIAVEWLRQRWSKGTFSAVLSFDSDCVLQVILGRSQ